MTNVNKISLKGLIVWLICASFFMYEFLLRTVLGTFQYPLMHDLQLSPVRFALLSSTAYQLIYGIMQIPVGILADRFGLKKTLLSAVFFCAIANIGFSFSHHFASAIFFRVLMGFGSSFGFVCLLLAVYDWMPRRNIALFIGMSQFIGTMGPMLAAGPFNALAQASVVSWREIFIALGLIGLTIATLVLLFVDKNRQNQGKFIILSRPSAISENLSRLLSQKQVWFIAVFSASAYFSIEYLSENEGVEFLVKKGFSSTFSSYMITLAWLGYALGCPLLGLISDKMQRRKPVMYISALMALTALTGIIYFSLGKLMTAACFILLGAGASGQSVGFAIMAEQCKEEYLAVGLAINNGMIMLFAAVNAPLIGSILSHLSAASPITMGDYQTAFMIMIMLVFIAIFFAVFAIKETFCKSVRENTTLNPGV
ncbi:MFS transporter [Legionella israelensis]|nr:MFS transporter [Legionella israelensis]